MLEFLQPLHPSVSLLPQQTEKALAGTALLQAPLHFPQCLAGTLFAPDRTQMSLQIPP